MTAQDITPLLPCPFCGGEMEATVSEYTGQIAWIQHRDNEKQMTCPLDFGGMDDALPPIVEAWNTRPSEGEVTVRLYALVAELETWPDYMIEALRETDEAKRLSALLQPTLPVPQGEVERAAKAIFAVRFCGKPPFGDDVDKEWGDLADGTKEHWRTYARAALTTSPDTREALEAVRASIVCGNYDRAKNSIDAILGQPITNHQESDNG